MVAISGPESRSGRTLGGFPDRGGTAVPVQILLLGALDIAAAGLALCGLGGVLAATGRPQTV